VVILPMRIIAGEYKGRRLLVPSGGIRPTSDRLKEALFSALGNSIRGSVWVDACAGSGAVGIEALSRGAGYVVFNDRSQAALRTVRKNLERCQVKGGYEILRKDVFALLRKPPDALRGKPAAFLFFDPPYDFGRYDKLLTKALACPLFEPRRMTIILEIFKKTRVGLVPEGLRLMRTLKRGDNHILLLTSAQLQS
jgi:16S rRNA (guanine(966)-N(2))-methyltransferase RsmD